MRALFVGADGSLEWHDVSQDETTRRVVRQGVDEWITVYRKRGGHEYPASGRHGESPRPRCAALKNRKYRRWVIRLGDGAGSSRVLFFDVRLDLYSLVGQAYLQAARALAAGVEQGAQVPRGEAGRDGEEA